MRGFVVSFRILYGKQAKFSQAISIWKVLIGLFSDSMIDAACNWICKAIKVLGFEKYEGGFQSSHRGFESGTKLVSSPNAMSPNGPHKNSGIKSTIGDIYSGSSLSKS